MKSSANRLKKSGFYRSLAFQSLETRNLLTISLANSLADVVVTATGVSISGTIVNPAGETLVILGNTGNDVISIQADALVPGAVDVIFNGTETVWPAPIASIVAHGGGGNDTITVSSGLTIPSYLFSGAGHVHPDRRRRQ